MKPRTVRTTKLLAVAVLAPMSAAFSLACTSQPDATPERASADLPARRAPSSAGAASAPAPPAASSSAATASASSSAHAAPEHPDPALYPLAAELDAVGKTGAFARLSHFRPLCDKDGFPLVGNLVRKGPGPGADGGYVPSQFCADVRKKATQ